MRRRRVDERMLVNVITMGCSKNLVDSEVLLGQLNRGAVTLVGDVDQADVVVINTCGFVEAAKRESLDVIHEALQRKERGEIKKVIVMGCLTERYGKELREEIPGLDAIFGSDQLAEVLDALGVDFKKELLGERLLTTPIHFAYLKISEGCDHPCSFCAIPLMRGKQRSKPLELLLREARYLASQGVKELILIAQDTTAYGLDLYGRRELKRLLYELCDVDGIEWIRLMYAFPSKFPLEILEVFKSSPKLCRYLDMPVQHASDDVLKSMRRGITNRATRDLIRRIKDAVPDIALRTTLIVGYPNETERDFQELYDFVAEMQFHRLGVFTYSQEDGTTAYPLGDPLPEHIKEQRRDAIMKKQQEISARRNEELLGSVLTVLIDRHEDGHAIGRTQWDAPEIDQEVLVRMDANSDETLRCGNFSRVEIVDAYEYDLVAIPAR